MLHVLSGPDVKTRFLQTMARQILVLKQARYDSPSKADKLKMDYQIFALETSRGELQYLDITTGFFG